MGKLQGSYVAHVTDCELAVGSGEWAFAVTHAADIEAHWTRRSRENPGFFNGCIHLLEQNRLDGAHFCGRLLRTDFKSYLYWRETGFADRSVRDAFGSALIRSKEGHVLLGRQREGNVNAGLAYLPGGFIDERDVAVSGEVDITASILREVAEETGLGAFELTRTPGYLVTIAGPLVSIAVGLRSALPSEALIERIGSHIAGDAKSELVSGLVVRSVMDMQGVAMPDYARLLVSSVFEGVGKSP